MTTKIEATLLGLAVLAVVVISGFFLLKFIKWIFKIDDSIEAFLFSLLLFVITFIVISIGYVIGMRIMGIENGILW